MSTCEEEQLIAKEDQSVSQPDPFTPLSKLPWTFTAPSVEIVARLPKGVSMDNCFANCIH